MFKRLKAQAKGKNMAKMRQQDQQARSIERLTMYNLLEQLQAAMKGKPMGQK